MGEGEGVCHVWHTNVLVIIDPVSGIVTGVVNLNGLLSPSEVPPGPDGVLNRHRLRCPARPAVCDGEELVEVVRDSGGGYGGGG